MSAEHDEQCEAEYVVGAAAYTDCGCEERAARDGRVHMVDPVYFFPNAVCRAPMRSMTGRPEHGGATADWARVTCPDCLAHLTP